MNNEYCFAYYLFLLGCLKLNLHRIIRKMLYKFFIEKGTELDKEQGKRTKNIIIVAQYAPRRGIELNSSNSLSKKFTRVENFEVMMDNEDSETRDGVPESPPMSQSHISESQASLLIRLEKEITPKEASQDVYDIVDDYESLSSANPEEIVIDEDEDEDTEEKRSSNDVVIEMDIEDYSNPPPATENGGLDNDDDDISFLKDVEFLEKQHETLVKIDAGTMDVSITHQFVPPMTTERDRQEEVKKLKRLDASERIFPDVKSNSFHTVAFFMSPDYKPGDYLRPHPQTFQPKWDPDFVPLPCAKENTRVFRIRGQQDSSSTDERNRFREERIWLWSRIQQSLAQPILGYEDIVANFKNYINIKGNTSFGALYYCLENVMSKDEKEQFVSKALPCMQTLTLDTESLITTPLPLLKKFKNQSVSLSQKQVACLLSNAFFSTFPKRFQDEYQFPTINFIELFESQEDDNESSRLVTKAQKIRCILNYFCRIAEDMPTGVVTFTRRSIRNSAAPKWEESLKKIMKIIPLCQGTIEDDGVGMLQVDFANKLVGGGVLGGGAVQEEILFVIYPELLISRLLTEKLTSCEALVITGCERFSNYTGYARTFRYDGNYFDTTQFDQKGRRCTQFVAMDALYVTRPVTQFHPRFLTRELNKAFVGFSSPIPVGSSVPVATGKWGCGAFNGNPQLKAILQLMAASQAGRDVVFFTFSDSVIQREIEEMYEAIKNSTIKQVWLLLSHYYTLFCTTPKPKYNLHEYLVRYANCDDFPSVQPETSSSSNQNSSKLKEVPITQFYTNGETSSKKSPIQLFEEEDEDFVYQKISSKQESAFNTKLRISASKFVKSDEKRLTEDQIASILMEDSQSSINGFEQNNQSTSSSASPKTIKIPFSKNKVEESLVTIYDTDEDIKVVNPKNGLESVSDLVVKKSKTEPSATSSSTTPSSFKGTKQTTLTDFYKA